MHTEHLQNVHPGWVAGGWLVALAVTSLVALVFASLELTGMGGEGGEGGEVWTMIAIASGFFAGGFFLGFKSIDAPLLHAVGVGLFTILAWFVLNAIVTIFFDDVTLTLSGGPATFATALVLQFAAALAGAWVGHRLALGGGPEPAETESSPR